MMETGIEHSPSRFTGRIHLLYVPTLHCNLSCRYCYLGAQTDSALRADAETAVPTLEQALRSFIDSGILPFNVSLHGGEPTTLPSPVLESLFGIIRRHYLDHFDELTALGYRKSDPHIKTNLYNFHHLYDLFDRHRVSISASVDLPLSLHGTYRVDRRGRSWLEQTKANLRLLGRYPHSKKMSATLYREHLEDIPALISDIWLVHREFGFDMNNFNFMFGFHSPLNREKFGDKGTEVLHQADEDLQLRLYDALHHAFTGTELEYGLKRNWFDEFKPDYCTNAFNCGERFFLLQGDGRVYSCVRGQGLADFYFGNILTDPVADILAAARSRISHAHQKQGLDADCRACDHLYLCHTGCPVVKQHTGCGRSYTCRLQKTLYRDNPASYPPTASAEERERALREYIVDMHPGIIHAVRPDTEQATAHIAMVPAEIREEKNSLVALIARDPVLQSLYSGDAFALSVNGERIPLGSQILNRERSFHFLGPDDQIMLYITRSLFAVNCDELIRNTLYIQMLRDTPVVYGDEKRTKQEHLFTHQVYYNLLRPGDAPDADFVAADLTGLFRMYRHEFRKGVLNNMLVTTQYLRDYHYQKQKANAFYHIQAINLPFQNFEFYWNENTERSIA